MSKILKVTITYSAPIEQLVGDDILESDFNNDASEVEKYFTENEGLMFWTEFPATIQDATIRDTDEVLISDPTQNNLTK